MCLTSLHQTWHNARTAKCEPIPVLCCHGSGHVTTKIVIMCGPSLRT